MALLGFLGSRRDDKENDARTFLDEAISSSAETSWPVPVLHFLRHDISAEALLKAAGNDTQKTEAHTFLGLELLNRGDLKQAREHLTWVRDRAHPAQSPPTWPRPRSSGSTIRKRRFPA